MSNRSNRLLKIYSRLKLSPVTIEILENWAVKNDFNFSTRTFYRDLEILERSLILSNEKLTVTIGEKNKKTWKIVQLNREEPLTEFDINSYILFKSFIPLPVVSARNESLGRILQIFYSNFSKSHFENFVNVAQSQITSSHFFEGLVFDNYRKILDDCIWSIQNKREMELISINYDFTSIGSSITFPQTFLPIQILYHRGLIYLSGFIKNDKKLIFLGLEQIKKYKLSNVLFENKKLLSMLEKELSNRFGITQNINTEIYNIEIEFSELTGNFVRHQHWHNSQNFQRLENGNFLLKMTCGINRELVGWIFQWMSNIKIVKPEILKTMVIDKLKEILDGYESDNVMVYNNSFLPHL